MLGVAAPPPPLWCSAHGWVVCPLHEYGPAVDVDAVGQSPTSVFEFDRTSSAAAVDADVVAPCLPPPTPAVVEMEGDKRQSLKKSISLDNQGIVTEPNIPLDERINKFLQL